MNHEHAQSNFLSALDDRLPSTEREAFFTHLATCSACSKAFDEFKAVHSLLATVAAEQLEQDEHGPELIMAEVRKSSNAGRVVMWWKAVIKGIFRYGLLFTLFSVALVVTAIGVIVSGRRGENLGSQFEFIEGAAGALIMVAALAFAVVLPFCRRLAKSATTLAPMFASLAVGLFIARSTLSLFFGTNYTAAPVAMEGRTRASGPDYKDLVRAFHNNIGDSAKSSNEQAAQIQRLEEKAESEGQVKGLFGSVIDEIKPMNPSTTGVRTPAARDKDTTNAPRQDSAVAAAPKPFAAQEPQPAGVDIAPLRSAAGEGYAESSENGYQDPRQNPLSTFSIDVDTASYANARRFITANGMLPPKNSVRIEEFINYFKYDYPEPNGKAPVSITADVAEAPWAPEHRIVRVGLRARSIPRSELPPSNIVFLVDTSGSMSSADKLPLVQQGLNLLVDELSPRDRVALVAYAGSAGLVLPSTAGDEKAAIRSAINRLSSGGSTAGGAGLQLAYEVAKENFISGGNNRVILATDGDFNVGISSDSELVRFIEEKRATGVFLSVLGVGTGNYQDAKMEQLADKGNGNFSYLDNLKEAEKVLVREMSGTLFTVAKDVKVQVEFNPARVSGYRLVGYENRMLNKEDFNNDRKDAGEMGAGHQVTALYEVIPAGSGGAPLVDDLKYQRSAEPQNSSEELLTVKLRYKAPESDTSELLSAPLVDTGKTLKESSADFQFATAVAEFGLILRESDYRGRASLEAVVERAKSAKGDDAHGDRAEFIRVAETAKLLAKVRQ